MLNEAGSTDPKINEITATTTTTTKNSKININQSTFLDGEPDGGFNDFEGLSKLIKSERSFDKSSTKRFNEVRESFDLVSLTSVDAKK